MPVLSKCLRITFYIISKYRFLLVKKNHSSRNCRFTDIKDVSNNHSINHNKITSLLYSIYNVDYVLLMVIILKKSVRMTR